MQVGKYKIGRFHAIIKKIYEDGSVSYETNFISRADLTESIVALRACIGHKIGLATDNPQVLTGIKVIYGKQDIIKELEEK